MTRASGRSKDQPLEIEADDNSERVVVADECREAAIDRCLLARAVAVAIRLITSGWAPAFRLFYLLSVMLGAGLWMFVSALSLAHLCRVFGTLFGLCIPHAASLLAIGFSHCFGRVL